MLQEEAEQVTLKLQKLWRKFGEAKGDLEGQWSQWAAEKEEMLDSVRMLQQQLTLKDLVIQAFIPQEDVQKVQHVTYADTPMYVPTPMYVCATMFIRTLMYVRTPMYVHPLLTLKVCMLCHATSCAEGIAQDLKRACRTMPLAVYSLVIGAPTPGQLTCIPAQQHQT